MSHRILWYFCIFVEVTAVLGNTSSFASAASSLSLTEVYQSALTRSEDIAVEKSKTKQSEERVTQARSHLFPTISFNANYLRQDDVGVRSSSASSARGEQTSTRFTLYQPLYAGGRDSAALAIAKAERSVQQENEGTARLTLYVDVARTFFQVLILHADTENNATSIRLMRERISDLQKRTRIGRSRANEVLTAQAQLAMLEAQMLSAQGQLKIARDRLSSLAGIDGDASLAAPSEESQPPEPLADYLAMLEQRSDYLALKAQLAASRSAIDLARAEHYPTVALTGNSYLSRTGAGQGSDWDVGVGLTIPIYQGGIVQAKVREATEKQTETELRLHRLRRMAEESVRAAHYNLTSTIGQIEPLKAALAMTERNYREQTRDYRFGLVTNLDVLQAMNAFQDAKRAVDRIRIQSMLNRAELNAAVGRIQ